MSTAVRDARFLVAVQNRCGTKPFFPTVVGPMNFSSQDCNRAAKSLASKGFLRKLSTGEYQVVPR